MGGERFVKDLSTRRLKRYYWKHVRMAWYWESKDAGDWFTTWTDGYDRGAAHKSKAQERATAAKEELQHRGFWLP